MNMYPQRYRKGKWNAESCLTNAGYICEKSRQIGKDGNIEVDCSHSMIGLDI